MSSTWEAAMQQQHGAKLSSQLRNKGQQERQAIVIWKQPIRTLKYFVKEVSYLLSTYSQKVLEYKVALVFITISILGLTIVAKIQGPHQHMLNSAFKVLFWYGYWMSLGVVSSFGLSTGVMYLAPHIAKVTLAGYECNSLNFPEPPYPDDIVCPMTPDSLGISIFSIMAKVRLESVSFGVGTVLGEIPAYFIARAARLSKLESDKDDKVQQFEEVQRRKQLSLVELGKLLFQYVMKRAGFWVILICTSIPNPLFDLAGITCGHFLVSFWTFFGATLIGKAIIKLHIKMVFVIITFSETLILLVQEWLVFVPIMGEKLQEWIWVFFNSQKKRLHKMGSDGDVSVDNGGFLASLFEKLVAALILYFVVSIVNSLAQSYHKRLHRKKAKNAN